jgi:hypothetical protein
MPYLAIEAGFTGGAPQVLVVVAGDQRSEVWVELVHGCSFWLWVCVGRCAAGVGRRGLDARRGAGSQT